MSEAADGKSEAKLKYIEDDEKRVWDMGFFIMFLALFWASYCASAGWYYDLLWLVFVFLAFSVCNSATANRNKGQMQCFSYFGIFSVVSGFALIIYMIVLMTWLSADIKWCGRYSENDHLSELMASQPSKSGKCHCCEFLPTDCGTAYHLTCADNAVAVAERGVELSVAVTCPTDCGNDAAEIVGTNTYTDVSPICKAAMHSTGLNGGAFTLTFVESKNEYRGTEKAYNNHVNVTSSSLTLEEGTVFDGKSYVLSKNFQDVTRPDEYTLHIKNQNMYKNCAEAIENQCHDLELGDDCDLGKAKSAFAAVTSITAIQTILWCLVAKTAITLAKSYGWLKEHPELHDGRDSSETSSTLPSGL
jgi:hypothetical protein